MSIYLYTGTPGSYKSFHAVKTAIRQLKSGGNLITNFPLSYHKRHSGIYQFLTDDKITVDFLIKFAKENHHKGYKSQTLLIIDEASIKFNCRDYARKDRLQWIKFLACHRHYNYDIILICQQDIMIDKQIRGFVETEYRYRALRNFKLIGSLLNLLFRGCYMRVEVWYPIKRKAGSEFCVFNKRIAKCYDTMALFGGGSYA